VDIVAGPVSKGMVSGTTAMLAPTEERGVVHLLGIGSGLGGFRIQHAQGRGQQQHATTHLEARQRNAEKVEDLQPEQRAGGDHHEAAERRDPDRALALFAREVLGVMDEEGHDRQRIDNGQQRDQGLEVHHAGASSVWGASRAAYRPPVTSRMAPVV
jgi:hypothetical protein